MNSDPNPGGKGDIESLDALKKSYGIRTCMNPLAIEVRNYATGELVVDKETPQKFASFDNVAGFSCLNKEQSGETCQDYEIRLCCPRKIMHY
jgi:hypothetical protein